MPANHRYITSILLSFSTFLEKFNLDEAQKAKAKQLLLAFLAQKKNFQVFSELEAKSFLNKRVVSLAFTDEIKKIFTNFIISHPPYQRNVYLLEFLLALKSSNCSKATIKNYKSDISQFFNFNANLSFEHSFTKPVLDSFYRHQLKQDLKVSTLKRRFSSLIQFALWLKEEQILTKTIAWINYGYIYQPPQENSLNKTQKEVKLNSSKLVKTQVVPFKQNIKANARLHQEQRAQAKQARFELKKFSARFQERLKDLTPNFVLPYINLIILILFFAGLGVFGYRQLFTEAEVKLAYPNTPISPNRVLSFQGRLTDQAQNPITGSTAMQFILYDDLTAGTNLWSGSCNVDPDQDGIFAVGLGSDCGTEITEDVFSENSNIWLEVKVGSAPQETLTPRQPIRTVAYALNSETLQGYPITATGAATVNTVLTMNEGGEVVLGEVSPKIRSVSGNFAIEGNTLTLQTSAGSNGNIVLDPDGIGGVISQGYLSAPGATFSATYAGGTPLTLKAGPSATADIMRWQTSSGTTMGGFAGGSGLFVGSAMSANASRFYVGNDDVGDKALSYMYSRHRNNSGSNSRNLWLLTDLTPTANSSATAYGLRSDLYTYTAYDMTGTLAGMSFGGNVAGTGNISTLYGIDSRISSISGAAGTVSLAAANNISFGLGSGATTVFTNAQGIRINAPTVSGGSITNLYGIYMDSLTAGGTSNYSIYTNLGNVSLGDNLILRNDNDRIQIGAGQDLELYHDGTNSYITNNTGDLYISDVGTDDVILSNNGGNVGIGLTNPTYPLHVAGNVGISDTFDLYSYGSQTLGNRTYTEDNYITDASTFTAAIDALDQALYNVSVGTGGLWLDGAPGNDFIYPNSTYSRNVWIPDPGRLGVGFQPDLMTSAHSAFNGNVGINNLEAYRALHIDGEHDAIIRLSDSNASTETEVVGYLEWYRNLNASRVGYLGFMSSANSTLDLANSISDGNLNLSTAGNGHILLTAGGNVGIGITNPSSALQVDGNITPVTTDQDLGTSSLRWDLLANTIDADSTVTLTGLGTGTDDTVLILNSSNQVTTDEIDSRVWGSSLVDGSGTANYVARWTPDTNTLGTGILYDNGTNIGIGLTTPSYPLHVAGNVGISDTFDLYSYGSQTLGNRTYTEDNYITDASTFTAAIDALDQAVYDVSVGTGGLWLDGGANDYVYPNSTYSSNVYLDTGKLGVGYDPSTITGGVAAFNGNVGIGTTTPLNKLDVVGTSAAAGTIKLNIQNTTATGFSSLYFKNSSDVEGARIHYFNPSYAGATAWSANDLAIANNTGDISLVADNAGEEIKFFTGASALANQRMVITATGNIGIGTTNPYNKLHIMDSAVTGSDANADDILVLEKNGNANFNFISSTTGNSGLLFSDDTRARGILRYLHTTDSMELWTNGAQQVTILSTGNVGIATTTPTSVLNIYDPDESVTLTNFTQNVNNAGLLITTNYTGSAYTPGVFWNNSDNNATKPKAGIWMFEDGTGTDLYFGTSNSYATGITNNGLVLDRAGNVGIGITNPTYDLQVYGSALIGDDSSIVEIASGAWNISATGDFYDDSGDHTITTSAGDIVLSPSTGFVGIGTTTPGYTLSINNSTSGQIGLYYAGTARGRISAGDNIFDIDPLPDATAISEVRFFRTTNTTGAKAVKFFRGNNSTTTDAQIGVDGSITYFNSGNVGILTTTPNSYLASNTQGLVIAGTGGRSGAPQDGSERVSMLRMVDTISDYGSGTATIGEIRSGIAFYTSETSSPGAGISGAIYNVNENTYNTNLGLAFYTQASTGRGERLRINGSGNIGVGTTNPTAKLDVSNGSYGGTPHSYTGLLLQDDTHAMITVGTPNNVSGYLYFADPDSSTVAGIGYTHSSNHMFFRINDGERMRIDSNGNVGIGTATPTAKLDVNGTTILRDDISQTGGVNALGNQESMVPNASFEAGVGGSADGWTAGTRSNQAGGGYINHGSYVLAVTNQTSYSACFPIRVGQTYNVYASILNSGGYTHRLGLVTYATESNCTANTSGSTTYTVNHNTTHSSYTVEGGTVTASGSHIWARAVINGTTGTVYFDAVRIDPSSLTTGMDLAEVFLADPTDLPQPGQLVSASTSANSTVEKSQQSYDEKLIGIVTTKPGITLGESNYSSNTVKVALAGQVPVIVTAQPGTINKGDYLTSSSLPGIAMKATESGPTVAKALASNAHWSEATCPAVNSINDIIWPNDDGMNSTQPCFRLPNNTFVGKLMVFVNTSWHDPHSFIADSGEIKIINDNGVYQVTQADQPVSKISAFTQAFIANLEAGLIKTQELIAQSFQATSATIAQLATSRIQLQPDSNLTITNADDQTLASFNQDGSTYLANLTTESLQTSTISTQNLTATGSTLLADLTANSADIASISATSINTEELHAQQLNAASSRLAYLEAQMAEIEQIQAQTAQIMGDATISGKLTVAQLEANSITVNGESNFGLISTEASFSANQIVDFDQKVAQSFKQPSLLATLLGDNYTADTQELIAAIDSAGYDASGAASLRQNLAQLELTIEDVVITPSAAYVDRYFEVNGTGYIADALGIGNYLLVGEGMKISANSLEVLASATNPVPTLYLQASGVGQVSILAEVMTINDQGKVNINGDLNVTGKIASNQVETKTLVSELIQSNQITPNNFDQPLQIKVAGASTESGEVKRSSLQIIDELGIPVATISAQGQAEFAGGLALDSQDLTNDALGELVAKKTTGKAVLKAGETELIIKSALISNDSRIYVTPLSSTNNQVLYVKHQTEDKLATPEVEGEFSVGFDQESLKDVEFNWWIVN